MYLQPLLVPNVDENIAAEIDDALLHEVDKEEIMRRVSTTMKNYLAQYFLNSPTS
jgi:hypothetical protein